MDSGILNIPTGLHVNDRVLVTERLQNISFEGTVVYTEIAPINAGLPYGSTTEYIYIRFDDPSAYFTWLKRGSPLIVKRDHGSLNKCVVREINTRDNIISVGEKFRLFIHGNMGNYNITSKDIDSMLVWRVAYNLQKI